MGEEIHERCPDAQDVFVVAHEGEGSKGIARLRPERNSPRRKPARLERRCQVREARNRKDVQSGRNRSVPGRGSKGSTARNTPHKEASVAGSTPPSSSWMRRVGMTKAALRNRTTIPRMVLASPPLRRGPRRLGRGARNFLQAQRSRRRNQGGSVRLALAPPSGAEAGPRERERRPGSNSMPQSRRDNRQGGVDRSSHPTARRNETGTNSKIAPAQTTRASATIMPRPPFRPGVPSGHPRATSPAVGLGEPRNAAPPDRGLPERGPARRCAAPFGSPDQAPAFLRMEARRSAKVFLEFFARYLVNWSR